MLILALLAITAVTNALDNGLGLTPPMGYSSWMDTSSAISEARIKDIANGLIRTGLAGKGYIHVNVDEGWLAGRDPKTKMIISNSTSFPSGMKGLGDWIHAQRVPQTGKYLKYGLYTSRGTCQCSTSQYHGPGSYGYEKEDAQYFANAGADYLKEDSCCGSQVHSDAFADYARMRDALNATGRPIYFSLCGWYDWYAPVGKTLGNSWRIAGDGDSWPDLVNCINTDARLPQYAGKGGWNDPDLLVGTGVGSYGPDRGGWYQTDLQSRSQFSMWCVLAAPLLISANVNAVSAYALETWGNVEAIAVNQDPLGKQGIRVYGSDMGPNSGVNIFARQLQDGSYAVVFLNNNPGKADITCDSVCFAQMHFGAGVTIGSRTREFVKKESHLVGAPQEAPVVMQPCQSDNPNQQWITSKDGTIRSQSLGWCLNIWNCSQIDDADVRLAPCNAASQCGQKNTEWTIISGGTITSKLNGKCLDQYEFTSNRVDAYTCNGGNNQVWSETGGSLQAKLSGQCLTAIPPPVKQVLTVRDLWAHANLPDSSTDGFTAPAVPGEGGCAMYRFTLKK